MGADFVPRNRPYEGSTRARGPAGRPLTVTVQDRPRDRPPRVEPNYDMHRAANGSGQPYYPKSGPGYMEGVSAVPPPPDNSFNQGQYQYQYQFQPQPYMPHVPFQGAPRTQRYPAKNRYIFSSKSVPPSFCSVYTSGRYAVLWDRGTQIMILDLENDPPDLTGSIGIECGAKMETLSLPDGESVTSLAFCNTYIFYTTTTGLYALHTINGTINRGQGFVRIFKTDLSSPCPLHNLAVYQLDQQIVAVFGAGYGIQYYPEGDTYYYSACEVVSLEFLLSDLISVSASPDESGITAFTKELHTCRYALKAPIFTMISCLDRSCEEYLNATTFRRTSSSYRQQGSANSSQGSGGSAAREGCKYIKVCISTVFTSQPVILILIAMVNLRSHMFNAMQGEEIEFSAYWSIPYRNDKSIVCGELCPARGPMALSDDGKWLLTWCHPESSSQAVWVIAFDVSFSIIANLGHGEAVRYKQFLLPPSSVYNASSTSMEIVHIAGKRLSNMEVFYILGRSGNIIALYALELPMGAHQTLHSGPNTSSGNNNAGKVALLKIDDAYRDSIEQGYADCMDLPLQLLSISFYDYIQTYNRVEVPRFGLLLLWENGLLALARPILHTDRAAVTPPSYKRQGPPQVTIRTRF